MSNHPNTWAQKLKRWMQDIGLTTNHNPLKKLPDQIVTQLKEQGRDHYLNVQRAWDEYQALDASPDATAELTKTLADQMLATTQDLMSLGMNPDSVMIMLVDILEENAFLFSGDHPADQPPTQKQIRQGAEYKFKTELTWMVLGHVPTSGKFSLTRRPRGPKSAKLCDCGRDLKKHKPCLVCRFIR